MKRILFSVIIFVFSITIYSQSKTTYRSPLDIPLVLSANFGELRPHHFHTGIDLKTQGGVNKPIYSIESGYVSRISVSPRGYGLAIYVNHPSTGEMSVYGHLNKYAAKIAEYIKEKQYEKESYAINIYLDEKELPVNKGDLIAYSGNTGSSGGPHVHFEIRSLKTEQALDPLPHYMTQIADKKTPQVKGITVYPITGKGVAGNSASPIRRTVTMLKSGGLSSFGKTVEAWGVIGLGIHANDRMDNTSNIYGVKSVKLFCDEKEIFSSNIAAVDFDKSKMINSMIDYDHWTKTKQFYMKSFVEPGNKLPIYESQNNGFIEINEERVYNFRYELVDVHGNKASYKFSITGKRQEIPTQPKASQAMIWDHNNYFVKHDFRLTIPARHLYDNLGFTLDQKADSSHYSDRYFVNNNFVPLNGSATMKIKLTVDTLAAKKRYGMILIKNKKESWAGGEYHDGYITTSISELGGEYVVGMDDEAPKIVGVQPEKWVSRREIRVKVTDDMSGILSHRGTIDGKYALFEHDTKSTNYIYKFDATRLEKGGKHQFRFVVTDACGNESVYEYTFTY